jgi:hypothetical protein
LVLPVLEVLVEQALVPVLEQLVVPQEQEQVLLLELLALLRVLLLALLGRQRLQLLVLQVYLLQRLWVVLRWLRLQLQWQRLTTTVAVLPVLLARANSLRLKCQTPTVFVGVCFFMSLVL